MVNSTQWATLNRAFGYETISLIMDEGKSKKEIRSKMPYENVFERQIERIIDACWQDGLIQVTGTRGVDRFIINRECFSNDELEMINMKAISRAQNPARERGSPVDRSNMPREFFSRIDTDDNDDISLPKHTDIAKSSSKFGSIEQDYGAGAL